MKWDVLFHDVFVLGVDAFAVTASICSVLGREIY